MGSGVDHDKIVVLIGMSRTDIDHDEVIFIVKVVWKVCQNDQVVLVAGRQLEGAGRDGIRRRGSVRVGCGILVGTGDAGNGVASVISAGAPHITHGAAGLRHLDSDLVHHSEDVHGSLVGEHLGHAITDAGICGLETCLLRTSVACVGDRRGLVAWLVGG